MEHCICQEPKRKLYSDKCLKCGLPVLASNLTCTHEHTRESAGNISFFVEMVEEKNIGMRSPFDAYRYVLIVRSDAVTGKKITLEPEVNFFVRALEKAGAKVLSSCSGHPKGFYVVFDADYDIALKIVGCGYFHVSLMRQKNHFRIDLSGNESGITHQNGEFTEEDRNDILRRAAWAWMDAGLVA